ncbi:tetratricopeptide repeat protein [bacterium]|nr:tetratricopeptide repeat protein [bacterium]MBU4350420.1 tetratricopeptide repeat protein [bacterium]MBU4511279.1 tetratricopeptide repeat protein [bacterium]
MKRNIFILLIVASILIIFSTLIFASGTIDESLPSLIKRIKPSTVIIFTYDDKGEFLKLGSGFFISQNGDVITNYHVLQGASSAEIKTTDEKTYPITYIVAGDEQNDIIRLSVNISSQYVYPLSLSKRSPEVGERIIVYGSPLGLENTVSDGIVSAIRDVPDYGRIIQITAPISPGSSGSPVLNMQGEVIGIATFQMVEGQNLNFAIPSERIANLNLMEEEKRLITTEESFERENKEKKDSDYVYDAISKASYFIDKKEYEKALPYLEIAIKTDILSLKYWAYFGIGFCYDELGNYAKAIEAYKQAIRIDPDYADTHYNLHHNLGIDYGSIGNYTKAIESFKRAIRIDPDYADNYYGLGIAYCKLSFYEDAIESFKQVIRIDPDYADAYYNLGIVYGILGFYKDAMESLKQAISIEPDNAKTYSFLGRAYISLDNYPEAIESLKQAIRIDPDYAEAHILLGATYLIIGDRNSALNEYKILKELDIDKANELFDMIYE